MAKKVLNNDGLYTYLEGLKVKKIHPTAEELTKNSPQDVAYEVTIVGRDENRIEDIQGDVNVFTTGLMISAPKNSHIEILEHPQLFKAGYSLQGGVRLYNQATEGELLIPLYKFKDAEDLELPFRAALLVLRSSEIAHVDYTGSGKGDDDEEDNVVIKKKPSSKKKGGKTNHMF
jgi:hypothetical protein